MAGQAGQFDPQALSATLRKLGWGHGDLATAVHEVERRVRGGLPSNLAFATDTVASWTSGDRRPSAFYGARAWIAIEDAARREGRALTAEEVGFGHMASRPQFWEEVAKIREARGERRDAGQVSDEPKVAVNGERLRRNSADDADDLESPDLGAEARTFSLTYGILSPHTHSSVIDTIEASTYRLGRLYARTQPAAMMSRVHDQLGVARRVLGGSLHLADHARILRAAGWQSLLLAMLHYDLGQYEAGQAGQQAAMKLGQDVGDHELIGWAHETAAWFAIYEGGPQDIVDAASEGRDQSPPDSPARVMNVLKLGVGWARLGNSLEAERIIDEAHGLAERIPASRHPDHQFAFDRPKLDLYVTRIYALLRRPREAEERARMVIDQSTVEAASGGRYQLPPTRESFGRLDLASALLDRGELEEACNEAKKAFGDLLRHDVLNRAAEIGGRLRAVDASHVAVREYHDRYREARRRLGTA